MLFDLLLTLLHEFSFLTARLCRCKMQNSAPSPTRNAVSCGLRLLVLGTLMLETGPNTKMKGSTQTA